MLPRPLQHEFLIEMLDFWPETGEFKWRYDISPSGRAGKRAGYCQQTKGRKVRRQIEAWGHRFYEHRLAWFYVNKQWPTGEVDHINGDPCDNRISNLRVVDRQTNMQNIRAANKLSKSKLLGAAYVKDGCYRATIGINGHKKHLGYFASAEEAHSAYVSAKRDIHKGCTI